jgi:hypothetical protein
MRSEFPAWARQVPRSTAISRATASQRHARLVTKPSSEDLPRPMKRISRNSRGAFHASTLEARLSLPPDLYMRTLYVAFGPGAMCAPIL